MEVAVDVTNTGDVTGDEVVQFYTRTAGASVTRPVKELRGFQRVTLEPGETQTVVFSTPVTQMSYYDLDMRRVVEPCRGGGDGGHVVARSAIDGRIPYCGRDIRGRR